MNEEKNRQFSIKFKPSLMAKVEDYIDVVNANKESSERKLSKASFFNNVVADYFEGKVLTNDFIELDRPFYFNYKELKEKGVIEASSEVPIHDLDTSFIVKAVPNNLDVWNAEEETYSSGSSNVHKGLYVFYLVILNEEDFFKVDGIIERNFLFKYDSSANSLEVSLLADKDLYLYVPSDSTVLAKLEEEKDSFYDNIISDKDNNVDVVEWLKTFDVVLPFKVFKDFSKFSLTEDYEELLDKILNPEKVTVKNNEGNVEEGYFISSEYINPFFNDVIRPSLEKLQSERK
jgi:hypothetical protein